MGLVGSANVRVWALIWENTEEKGGCSLTHIIIHSKYFALSDWLRFPGRFFITAHHTWNMRITYHRFDGIISEDVNNLGLQTRWITSSSICIIDLIHDARHLCMHLRTDGIKAMSRGFSEGKQVINFSNTRNCGRVCLLLTTENEQLFISKTIMTSLYGHFIWRP